MPSSNAKLTKLTPAEYLQQFLSTDKLITDLCTSDPIYRMRRYNDASIVQKHYRYSQHFG